MFRNVFFPHSSTLLALLIALALCNVGCGGSSGSSNSSNTGAAATPGFSLAAGSYSSSQTVALTDSTSGATIYYTTDGSTPSTLSSMYSAAIPVNSTMTIRAVAAASGYSLSSVASSTYTIQSSSGPTVSVVLTSSDLAYAMTSEASVGFTTGTSPASTPTIVVDEAQSYQSVEGFGGSMTDSAAYLLNEVASSASRDSVMQALFTRNGNGIGLSFLRNPMGSSDIARTMYSYDDNGGVSDPTLANFSVAHDQADILPLTLKARQLNSSLKIMVNPWSPPGWMKSNGSMLGELSDGTVGTLLPTMYSPWANYFVDTLQAYAAAGVTVDYISLQNEPLYTPTTYPGMSMPATTQVTLLDNSILPALSTAGLSARVLLYDHNWDTPSYPETVLSDATVAASAQVAGVAWHGYEGTPGAMTAVHNLYPSLGMYMTEHSGGTWVTNQVQQDFEEITHVMRNWGKAYVKWSLALNENRGPHDGGCSTCSAPITVNSTSGAITYNAEFYTLGQFSKFILPGATRVYSSNALGLISSAYVNPDASKALVVFNDTTAAQTFQTQWGGQTFAYALPSYTGATFTWSGTQNGTPELNAKSQIMASSYSSVTNFESETTSDTSGGFDLGYSVNGATAVYKNVNFGSGVSGVNARLACYASEGTCGGTLEFHIDSDSGTLIASAPINSTGGWQDWETVAGAISASTTGVHDLYVVMKATNSGTNATGNLNWFQFN